MAQIEHFDAYDIEESNRIMAFDVFSILILLCDGMWCGAHCCGMNTASHHVAPPTGVIKEKVELLFEIGKAKSGVVTKVTHPRQSSSTSLQHPTHLHPHPPPPHEQYDLGRLVYGFLRGAYGAGITTSIPSPARTQKLINTLFFEGDTNSDGNMDLPEFSYWAMKHIKSMELLEMFGFNPAQVCTHTQLSYVTTHEPNITCYTQPAGGDAKKGRKQRKNGYTSSARPNKAPGTFAHDISRSVVHELASNQKKTTQTGTLLNTAEFRDVRVLVRSKQRR